MLFNIMCALLVKQIQSPVYTRQFIINTHWFCAAEIGLWRAQLEGLLHLKQNSRPLRDPLQPPLALLSHWPAHPSKADWAHTQAASPSPAQISNPSPPEEVGGWRFYRLFSQLSGICYFSCQDLPRKMDLRTPFVRLFPFSTTSEDFELFCSVLKRICLNKTNIQSCPNGYESKRDK